LKASKLAFVLFSIFAFLMCSIVFYVFISALGIKDTFTSSFLFLWWRSKTNGREGYQCWLEQSLCSYF